MAARPARWALGLACALAVTTPALAQPPGPAQPDPPAQTRLVHSPWTKICRKQAGKEGCFTVREARLENGRFVASVGLVEIEGEPRKILRATLPLGVVLRRGAQIIVDAHAPATAPYTFCLPNGCLADFAVSAELLQQVKGGRSLVLQAFDLQGRMATFSFPLEDFSKAHDGPATDPKPAAPPRP